MTTISFRLPEEEKRALEEICEGMGMSMATLMTVFAKTIIRERRIPFEVAAPDPFYTEANLRHLRKAVQELESGRSVSVTLEELEGMTDA